MLDFSQTISHHLFQPQVTSNSYNTQSIGFLHLMGLCLLSLWQAETFHEGLNESLEDWTFLQIYICVSVTIAMCIICHSLQVSSKQQQSFWWIHLHICAFQVISLHENCHEQSISVFRNEKSETHGWHFSRCFRKVNISLLSRLLHSNWGRTALHLFWSGAFFLVQQGKRVAFIIDCWLKNRKCWAWLHGSRRQCSESLAGSLLLGFTVYC